MSLLNVIVWFVQCDSFSDVYCLGMTETSKGNTQEKTQSGTQTRNQKCFGSYRSSTPIKIHKKIKNWLWQVPTLGWCQTWIFRLCEKEICHEPFFYHVFFWFGCSLGLMTIGYTGCCARLSLYNFQRLCEHV